MAVFVSRFASLVAIAAVLALGTRADALNITGLSIVKGGTNTVDLTSNSGNARAQNTSAVSTVMAPVAAPDTLGSYTEFITRYAMLVAADMESTSGSGTATRNMTSDYQITFTVDNPTGASLKIDIDTLRVGALTSISDHTGSSTITLGAVTGTVDSGSGPVTEAGLGAPAIAPFVSTASAQTTFSQAGTTLTILTSALTSTYVLDFDWTSSVLSGKDEGAIRMGISGSLTGPTEADDYPGATFPRDATQQSNDGHFVDVKATIIAAVPEPESAGLLAFGVLLLALRAHTRSRR